MPTEALAREVLDHLPDGCQIIDFEYRYRFLNDAAVTHARRRREALLGRTLLECYPGIETTPVFARLRECLEQRRPGRMHNAFTYPDGTRGVFELRFVPIPDGLCVLSVDVTELAEGAAERARAAEDHRQAAAVADSDRRRREAEARTTELFEHASDGIFVADLDGRYTRVNTAACRLLGCQPGDLIGKTIADLLPPQDLPRLAEAREQLLRGGVTIAEWRLRHADGHYVPVEVSAKILADGQWQAFVRDITERQASERGLRESEARLREATDAGGLGTFAFDFTTGLNSFSPRFLELLGLAPDARPPEDLRPDGPLDWLLARVHPDDRARVRQKLVACADPSGSRELADEHRVLLPDGTTRWVLVQARLLVEDGPGGPRPTLAAGTVMDVTGRKRLEDSLRAAEARATALLSTSMDAIIAVDAQHRIALFNEGAERVYGYARDEVLGQPVDLLLPERFRAHHGQRLDQLARGGEAGGRVGRLLVGLRRNGEEFPAEVAVARVDAGDGVVLTAALRDVSERTQLERRRRFFAEMGATLVETLDYRERLRQVARLAARDLADFCVIDLLEGGEMKRLECAARDPTRDWVCQLLASTPLDRSRPHLAFDALTTRRPQLLEHVTSARLASMSQSDDHRRALEALEPRSIITVPLVARGRVLGTIALVASRASRAYRAADLAITEDLARRAALAIDNAQLYESAQQAIAARNDILGVVAHDLRNPLQGLLLQSRVLRRHAASGEAWCARPAELIERAVARMTRLIEDLLDVSRIEAGHLSLTREDVEAAQLLADAAEAQRPLAVEAGLELDVEAAADLPAIRVDRHRLLQVFENLVGNALKVTPRGGRLGLSARREGDAVAFAVSDSGCGVAADELPHVFERFWQGRAAHRGAGLGLPIARGIVEAHGGHISLESEPGRGSTVCFTIPLTAAPRPPAQRPEP